MRYAARATRIIGGSTFSRALMQLHQASSLPWMRRGAGKTFFVDRWARDLALNHPVVKFDAWKNDRVADLMVAFIAELTAAIEVVKQQHGLSEPAKKKITRKTRQIVDSISQAAFPVAAAAAKAAVGKLSGLDFDKLAEEGTLSTLSEEFAEATRENAPQLLGVLFKETLKAYQKVWKGYRNLSTAHGCPGGTPR